MQWNILADALSMDGFYMKPALENWPTAMNLIPHSEGDGSGSDFLHVLDGIIAKKQELEACMRAELKSSGGEETRIKQKYVLAL